MISGIATHIAIKKVVNHHVQDSEDELAVEEPLEIRVTYFEKGNAVTKSLSVTMRTPGNDEELASGFLFTEGIINSFDQIQSVAVGPFRENIVTVALTDNTVPLLHKTDRNFYTTSSCGVCGKSSIEAIKTVSVFEVEQDNISLGASLFYGLQDVLKKQQLVFQSTGGLHAAAFFDFEGNLTRLREDVGRHNAVDKLIGNALMTRELPVNKSILLLSGRASFELIQKATMAGIKIVAAVGAPSSLAVQLAKEAGITLIGFLKNERFNIYSEWQRIA